MEKAIVVGGVVGNDSGTRGLLLVGNDDAFSVELVG
jgi:hypothetical protein